VAFGVKLPLFKLFYESVYMHRENNYYLFAHAMSAWGNGCVRE